MSVWQSLGFLFCFAVLALSTLVLSLTYLAVFWLERDQDHWPDDQF